MPVTYSEFIVELALGGLKNTPAVDTKTDRTTVRPDFEPEILSLVNKGLTDITSKIPVFTKDIYLVFQDNVYTYIIRYNNVGSYLDTAGADPFTVSDRFYKILDIRNEDNVLQDIDTRNGIMTISYDTLRFSEDMIEYLKPKVKIRYQILHPKIVNNTDIINLPENLYSCLRYYVYYLYFSTLNGKEHSFKSEKYLANYIKCMGEDVLDNASMTSEIDVDNRFNDKGFV